MVSAALLTASCSLVGSGDGGDDDTKVVLVTHESFVMSKKLQKQFEDESGYDLVIKASGDAGALTNKLVLTKDDPTGDAVFGIDNTFGSRAIDEGVLAPYAAKLPDGASTYALAGDDEHALTPVDTGNVCVNVDDTWFADKGIPEPRSLEDLVKPDYKDLFVTPGATTSSPGLAFLLATIAEFGEDGWQDYWGRLMANGTELTQGWSDAYEVDFTQGGGNGDRPIVLSYDSSPAFTLDGQGGTTTSALLDTCFRQVEYAGVLAGAHNPDGARALVDFMLSEPFQEALPDAMYVFPVDSSVALPEDWARFARQPEHPFTVDPAQIAEHRDEWLRDWSDVTSR
ncbi:MAG TPA: thiamine ABC transporter substrate-binding protein [Nocardioides sp.]|uniref:thiamine ABC transporter substrate-binding protein n=1 Tax=Nocardioides sp. TaxID=35761 RepID=UPI002E37A39B|nr:thiamine ABC transporter substrate-binding protein [Nocardioides sp.]HEX5087866.1 thiamine ABC transporter substrate-binding protein [Nocardioides sp.]